MNNLAIRNVRIPDQIKRSLARYLKTVNLKDLGVNPVDRKRVIKLALQKATREGAFQVDSLDGLDGLGYWTAIIGAVSALVSGAQQQDIANKKKKAAKAAAKEAATYAAMQAAALKQKRLAEAAVRRDTNVAKKRQIIMGLFIGIPILVGGIYYFNFRKTRKS